MVLDEFESLRNSLVHLSAGNLCVGLRSFSARRLCIWLWSKDHLGPIQLHGINFKGLELMLL